MQRIKIISFIGLFIVYFTFLIRPVHSYQSSAFYEMQESEPFGVRSAYLPQKSKYQYRGMEKCAAFCHDNDEIGFQYKFMKSGPHAKAFEILTSRKAEYIARDAGITGDPQESKLCLRCHATGGDLDPSFYTATYRIEDGVTCESCHKSPYSGKTYLPEEKHCLACHDNPVHKVKSFNFKHRVTRIAHHRPPRPMPSSIINPIELSQSGPVQPDEKIHHIGESYGGGIVFFVYDNGRHGMVAARSDQGNGIKWYNGKNKFTGSTGDGLGAGKANTTGIVSGQTADNPAGIFAARLCDDYSVTEEGTTYDDWYLPSKSELHLLCLQKNIVGGFSRGYWSSTEVDSLRAWTQYFDTGFQFSYGGKDYSGYVRAIRAF